MWFLFLKIHPEFVDQIFYKLQVGIFVSSQFYSLFWTSTTFHFKTYSLSRLVSLPLGSCSCQQTAMIWWGWPVSSPPSWKSPPVLRVSQCYSASAVLISSQLLLSDYFACILSHRDVSRITAASRYCFLRGSGIVRHCASNPDKWLQTVLSPCKKIDLRWPNCKCQVIWFQYSKSGCYPKRITPMCVIGHRGY